MGCRKGPRSSPGCQTRCSASSWHLVSSLAFIAAVVTMGVIDVVFICLLVQHLCMCTFAISISSLVKYFVFTHFPNGLVSLMSLESLYIVQTQDLCRMCAVRHFLPSVACLSPSGHGLSQREGFLFR